MAIRPEDNYPGKTVPASAAYPEGSAQNITTPGDGTGTPFEAAWLNDVWGFLQKLLAVAGITPSGNPDTVIASDYFDAINKIVSRFATHDDSGTASSYVLASASGADIAAYFDGHEVIFAAGNSNPAGASVINVNGIGAVSLTLPGGGALPNNSVIAGQYIKAVYRTTGTRYEITNGAESVPYDAIAVPYTAGNVKTALDESVKRTNHTGVQPISSLSDHDTAAHDALLIDAATLNSQNAAFYRDAGNLNAGTLPAARFDDTSHGTRGGGALHADATTGTDGFMSAADKTKLDGITSGTVFQSTAFTWTANIITTKAHGLGAVPKNAWLAAKCINAEHGYSVDDWAFNLAFDDATFPTYGPVNVRANSTNAIFASGDVPVRVINQIAAANADWVNITLAKWELYLFAQG